jgi:hypothetical protein
MPSFFLISKGITIWPLEDVLTTGIDFTSRGFAYAYISLTLHESLSRNMIVELPNWAFYSPVPVKLAIPPAVRISGSLDLENLQKQSDKEIIDFLTAIRGVGSWTSSWLLIRAFGRPDALPVEDLALRRALSDLMKKGPVSLTPAYALKISKKWSPFRSYVTTYLFAALRSDLLSE